MLPRFYAPSLVPGAPEIQLPPDESRHLRRVLRLGPGDIVRVFDGRGYECEARVIRLTREHVCVEPLRPVTPPPESRLRLILAQGALKGDKMDIVIRDAVMLGASAVWPVSTAFTDVPRHALARDTRLERWQRIAVASAKQCGRAVVPEVAAPAPLATVLARAMDTRAMMLVEPSAAARVEPLAKALVPAPEAVLLLVGPEGGWAAGEIATAQSAGCRLVTLGPRTLRADAAPLIALALVAFLTGNLGG
jgi:16S rRNA (uracil1498-N3)-methyltransferase